MTILIVLSIIALFIIALAILAFVYLREREPLLKAIKQNRTEDAIALIEGGASVTVRNDGHETPLFLAAARGNLELVQLLGSRGADVNAATSAIKLTPLMAAATSGNAEIVKHLIHGGADVNAADWEDNTALMLAARFGSLGAVRELLDGGADVNAMSRKGTTALCEALDFDRRENARALVAAGANVNKIGSKGYNALEGCIFGGKYEMAALLYDDLKQAGIDLHVKREYGTNTLCAAVSCALREQAKGDHPLIEIIRKLVRDGVDNSVALGIAIQHYAPEFFDGYKRDIIEILNNGT